MRGSKRLTHLRVWFMAGILMMLLSLLFSSCRSVQFVPVETVKETIEYRDRILRDSIHVLDSVMMTIKGDTVLRDRWRIVYKDRLVRDTTYVYRTDSVQIPYPVEKTLSRWERFKIGLGGWALGGALLLMMIVGCRIYKR